MIKKLIWILTDYKRTDVLYLFNKYIKTINPGEYGYIPELLEYTLILENNIIDVNSYKNLIDRLSITSEFFFCNSCYNKK